MPILRRIEEKFTVENEHWVGNGFRVRHYFAGGRNLLERFSPFALVDYNVPREFSPSTSSKGRAFFPRGQGSFHRSSGLRIAQRNRGGR